MSRRTAPIVRDHFYHVYNRGNQRGRIFFERENYYYFLKRFRHYFNDSIVVACYCLMPNHFHFLLKPVDDEFPKRMKNFCISYTKSINKKYSRVGYLFQGNYKAKSVDDSDVLLHLTRYIQLNPVFAGLVEKAEDWEFSSYREYLKIRNGTLPQPGLFLEEFTDVQEYREFMESYVNDNFEKMKGFVFEE